MGNCIWSNDPVVSDYDIDYMIYVDGLARDCQFVSDKQTTNTLNKNYEGFLYNHYIVSDPIPIR